MVKNKITEQELLAPYLEKIESIEKNPNLRERFRELWDLRYRTIVEAVWKVAEINKIDFIESIEESKIFAKETAERYSRFYEGYCKWRNADPKDGSEEYQEIFDPQEKYARIYKLEMSERKSSSPKGLRNILDSGGFIEQGAMELVRGLKTSYSIETTLRLLALQKRKKIPFNQRNVWRIRRNGLDFEDGNKYWNDHHNFARYVGDQEYHHIHTSPFIYIMDECLNIGSNSGFEVINCAAEHNPKETSQILKKLFGEFEWNFYKVFTRKAKPQTISEFFEKNDPTPYNVSEILSSLYTDLGSKVEMRTMNEETYNRIEKLVRDSYNLYQM